MQGKWLAVLDIYNFGNILGNTNKKKDHRPLFF